MARRPITAWTVNTRGILLLPVLGLLFGLPLSIRALAGGRISGTVADRSGAVIPKAMVTASNTDTGVQLSVTTNGAGVYAFPSLPVGHYDVAITAAGFSPYRRTGVTVDVNSALLVDAQLEL